MYRYRLSNHKVNEGLEKRSISGTTVFKRRWLYSEKPLFESSDLKPLVIMEEAESKEEFTERDRQRKEQVALQKSPPKKSIEEMTVPELLEVCKEKGFPPQETFGADREYLLSLLVLDTQIVSIGDE